MRVDSSEGHLNVREKALAATLPPTNAFFFAMGVKNGIACSVQLYMLYLLIVTILDMPCSESHLKQAKTDRADICS